MASQPDLMHKINKPFCPNSQRLSKVHSISHVLSTTNSLRAGNTAKDGRIYRTRSDHIIKIPRNSQQGASIDNLSSTVEMPAHTTPDIPKEFVPTIKLPSSELSTNQTLQQPAPYHIPITIWPFLEECLGHT